MPFAIALVTAIAGIAFWIMRARGAAQSASDLLDVANDVRLAARRFGFSRKSNLHPVESIEESPVAVATLGVAFLQLDDFPSREHQIALGRGLQSAFNLSLTDAEELTVLGRWLVSECASPDAAIPRAARRLYKIAGAEGFEPLMQVIREVNHAGGEISSKQVDALNDIRRAFRLTYPALSTCALPGPVLEGQRPAEEDKTMLDHLAFETPKVTVIAGAKEDWELVIGMEVHAQVSSNSKLFSGASTKFGAEPNSNVAFVDAAMPGMLPVINEFCVEQAVRTGLGLNAEINLFSAFDRKNYFYPDLPQGYQISQLYHPIVGEGEIIVDMGPGVARRVRVERIHLEQDAGKSIHDMDPTMSFVDFNRTGVALMEIVSRPDIRGPEEAAAYVTKLRQILRYLGTCDGNMQNGNLRADVNVSVCRPGQYEKYQETQDFSHLGTRCEIKNMNSMRFIQAAIDYEARRQIAILEDGGTVDQETRLYDPDKNETRSMRSKEEAHDYRYFPCPDLLPLEIEQAWVDDIAAGLPELPDAKKARFVKDFGLSEYDASVLTADVESAHYFEKVAEGNDGKLAANWVINELFGRLKKDDKAITESPVSPEQLGGVIALITKGDISGKIAKDLFEIVYIEGGDPAKIVEERGMKQVTDTGAIEAAVDEIIAANPAQVEKAKENPKLAGWFVGQVMKATGGKANPKAVNEIVAKKLAE